MLATHGEFFPYAVGLGQSGELRMFAADVGDDEHPPSTEVLQELVDGLRSDATPAARWPSPPMCGSPTPTPSVSSSSTETASRSL